jgi:biotin carboxyl carrier protein
MRKFIVTIDGCQYEVGVEEVGATSSPAPQVAEVKQVSAPVEAPKTTAKPAPAKPAQTPVNGTKLTAPMPGMIKGYKVSEGATVKEGDVVLVLEAMKMDNDITAPCDGVISFKAAVGSNVDTGEVMAVIG